MGVLGAPVGEHDDGISPAVECSDVGGDPPQLRAVQRAGTRRHVQPIGAGPSAGGGWRLTDGVGGKEADPYAVSLDDHRTTRCGQVPAGTDGLQAA